MNVGSGSERARIDVTPMADVVIVLLLIFMVMAPALAARGVELPRARNGDDALPQPALLLRADGALVLGEAAPWPREVLLESLRGALERQPEGERVVALRADGGADYARVREALALCREAGAERVALATRPPQEAR